MTDIISSKKNAVEIVKTLRQVGFKAFIVGGAVRDMVMGKEPKDYDIATNAAPEEIERLFEHVYPVGAHFGVSVVRLGENLYEVAQFRKDGVYRDGRRPVSVEPAEECEDVKRRDFTINALIWDPVDDRIIDHVGGIEDIHNRIIRSVGDPVKRFGEDHLRMLRAVRFAARFGFSVEPGVMDAIRRNASLIFTVSCERIGDEICKMFTGPNPERALSLLDESGLLGEVLPEVSALKGVMQPPEYHPEGDVFEHTLLMLKMFGGGTTARAFGILFHDIGKPATFEMTDRARFNRHDEVGAEIAVRILKRLRFENAVISRVHDLVRKHMQFMNAPAMKRSTFRRFIGQPEFEDMLELYRLDILASHGKLDTYSLILEKIASERANNKTLDLPERLVSGDDLVALGLESGPLFKTILEEVMDAQLEGRINTRNEALEFLKGHFSRQVRKIPEQKSTAPDQPAPRDV
ncbi:MAG: CCA tRNA nucleotidyltransferase [Candidatus Latescibacterota bacterium]